MFELIAQGWAAAIDGLSTHVVEPVLDLLRLGDAVGNPADFAEALKPGAPMLIHLKLDADVGCQTPGNFHLEPHRLAVWPLAQLYRPT